MKKGKTLKKIVSSIFIFIFIFTIIGGSNFKGELPEAFAAGKSNNKPPIKQLTVLQKPKLATIQSLEKIQLNNKNNSVVIQNVYGISEKEKTTYTNNDNTVTDEGYKIDPTVADGVYGNNTKSVLIRLKKTTDSNMFTSKKLSEKKSKKLKNTNTLVVDLTSSEIKNIQADKEVAFVEVDSPVEAFTNGKVIPLDTKANKKTPNTQLIPWGISAIGADLAMNDHKEGKAIKIAVLDTGVTNLADLNVQDGISFVDGIADYADDNGHGTHVAGTIAAVNNSTGVVGAASKAKIYAVKVLDKHGTGSYGQVIQGIDWAIENKMDIISISFGGTKVSQALHDAIIEANNKGILIISAAGNAGENVGTEIYPALFQEVISVGAVDTQFKRSWFSSTGSQIDLVAPGSLILSTLKDGGYGYLSGTSMAVPHVAGAAAVLWSENKTWTNEQIKQKLYDTATSLGNSDEYGHGLVNVAKALGLKYDPVAPPMDPMIPADNKDNVNLPFMVAEVSILLNESDSIPKMTSNTSPSGTASASSELDTQHAAWKAFDDIDSNDAWQTALNQTTGDLVYKFPTFNVIKAYTIMPQNCVCGPARAPKSWTLEGWYGPGWVILDIQSNVINWAVGVKKRFTVGNASDYYLYRIKVTANNGDTSYLSIGEMELITQIDAGTDTIPPTAPTNVFVVSKTDSTVNLSWTASTDNIGTTSYNIYDGGILIGTTVSTTYTVSNLSNGTFHIFTVNAKDAVGNTSAYSDALYVTTFSPGAWDSIPTMTSNTFPSGTASASSELDTQHAAWKAFDDNDSNNWQTALNQTTGYLEYNFPTTSNVIKNYTIMPQSCVCGPARAPKSWTLEGWWGPGWDILDIQSNVTDWAVGVKKRFTVSDANSYYRYRIKVTANNGDTSYLSIGEMELIVKDITPPTTPTNLRSSNHTLTSAVLTWNPATDNVGVVGYDIYNGNIKVGSVGSNIYTFSVNLTLDYSFTVKARDLAENMSLASNTVRPIKYYYDTRGRIDYILLSSGQMLKYNFDANGNLLNRHLQ